MTPTHRTGVALQKELRALLPTFLFTTGAVIAGGMMDMKLAALVLAVFCWGVVSLGAHSIGHEYSYRTLALLLAQPRGRTYDPRSQGDRADPAGAGPDADHRP